MTISTIILQKGKFKGVRVTDAMARIYEGGKMIGN
jgi:hypothetical protein